MGFGREFGFPGVGVSGDLACLRVWVLVLLFVFSIVVGFWGFWVWVLRLVILSFLIGGVFNAEFVAFLCRGLVVCFVAFDCI